MKNFVKENWYKLMVGSSMLMASFGFMIYAISPAYSNSDKNTSIPNVTNGVIVGNCAYFVDGGYLYKFYSGKLSLYEGTYSKSDYHPKVYKLPTN